MFQFRKNKSREPYITDCYAIQGRRENMEDAFVNITDGKGRYLVLVADGLGGQAFGEFASQTVIDVFRNTFSEVEEFDSIPSYFRKTIYVAATLMMQKSLTDPQYKEAATTLSGFAIDNDRTLFTVNVGDSRVSLYRDGKIVYLTRDHSPVRDMIDAGEITEEEAKNSPYRHLITSVISAKLTDIRIDVEKHGQVRKGDLLIASTDGFHDMFTRQELEQTVAKHYNSKTLARDLVMAAYDAGSTDNITVCTLRVIS